MSTSNAPHRPGALRRFARLVIGDVSLCDPPVISGLIDIENEHRWRHRS